VCNRRGLFLLALLALLPLGLALAQAQGASWVWPLPAWLAPPLVPADNPMSAAKVELGRRLFYDARLSADGTVACSTCHVQRLAFTDGRATPVGVTGEAHTRNAMSLANVGYQPVLTWANPAVRRLEHQALIPLFGETPVEMGMAGHEREMFARIAADPAYPPLFAAAFPERRGAIDLAAVTRAIAAFERALVSADSPYDRYRHGGQADAISDAAKRGESLFFSERLECFHCHGGPHFTDSIVHQRKPLAEFGFHNTGLYNLGRGGAYPPGGEGLFEHTGEPGDMGRFRAPSLRNVAVTAPYMHDGSIATLREVIAHYAAGGRRIARGPLAGNGARNPNRSPFVPGFRLSPAQTDDVIAFLESLTDEGFLTNPAFADPWPEGHPARAARREPAS
jgi:cytochrome c peroxidase